MRIINASETGTLVLGFQGEDQRLEIRFPLVDEKTGRNITEEFPGGSFSISIMLPGDPVEHIVGSEDFRVDGNWLIWTVKEAYTVGFGEGKLQLNYAFGGMAKSRIWKTNVRKSINSGSGTVPSWSDWKTELLNAAAAVESAVDSYDEMTAEAEELPAGSTPTAEMDHTGDHPVLKLGIPASQGGGGGDVQSVNGKTGVVVLNANDVGALPSSTPIPPAVTVDSALSGTSTNPVQNKVIKAKLDEQSETIVNLPSTDDSTATGPDLDISDEDGNVLVRMRNGQIQTKEFDSAKTPGTKDSIKQGPDLDVSDENGNVILRLRNGHIETKKFTSEKIEDRTTYLKVKSSGGDFSTLRGAIDYISAQGDADPDVHPYVIQIYPGTYNVMDDYTDEEINTADVQDYHYGFVGPLLDDGVSLIGMGDRDSVVLYGTLDPNDYVARVRGNISTLNTRGNVTLENLTVIAENLRYCVHDDFSYPSSKGQYRRVAKNCNFIGKNLSHTPACTWGGGMSGSGENATYENCDFGTDYGHHFDASQSCHITFKNCRGRKIRLAEPSGSIHHYVTIENSDFEMVSLMRSSGITTQHIHIEANGCENAYVSSNDGDIILTGAVSKSEKGNASIPVGTMVRRKSSFGNGYESTNDPDVADGIVVANDDYYTYVQRKGYINTRILEITGFSLGDYITIDSNNKLTTGGTASNAVGVVSFISQDTDALDQGIGFIKLLIGGMK